MENRDGHCGPCPEEQVIATFWLSVTMQLNTHAEAVALHPINTEQVAEELIEVFFAQVGIPQEVLTDQESNYIPAPPTGAADTNQPLSSTN